MPLSLLNSAYGSRTRDLRLERAASWTTRRMRHVLLACDLIINLFVPLVNSVFPGGAVLTPPLLVVCAGQQNALHHSVKT